MESPVLNSWKEIARYTGRGVRTVQRWERELGLPVRRPRHHLRSPVVAIPAEIDEWLRRVGPNSPRAGARIGPNQPETSGHGAPRVELRHLRKRLRANLEATRRNVALMYERIEELRAGQVAAVPQDDLADDHAA